MVDIEEKGQYNSVIEYFDKDDIRQRYHMVSRDNGDLDIFREFCKQDCQEIIEEGISLNDVIKLLDETDNLDTLVGEGN